jgi:O-antigen ligase
VRAWLREAADPTYALFLVTVAVCLVRAPDQPSAEIGVAGTTVSITPADVLLIVLLGVVAVHLARGRFVPGRGSLAVLMAAGAFAAWLFGSSVPNGATAVVAAGKLVELGVLTLAAAVLIDRAERLAPLVVVLVGITVAASLVATVGGLNDPGRRQESFLGEHALATVSTFALAVGLVALVAGRGDLGRLPLIGGLFGAAGIIFGASFSSLLGLYLTTAAILLTARVRTTLRARATGWTLLVCAAITAGTLMIRSDNLGFLEEWFSQSENTDAGATAGSWSSRLIYAYIGGRIFLDSPVFGTGWHGELPPAEYARYLPDARARYPDQPAHYFPPEDDAFIPQQAYDQVLFELGLVGGVLLLALGIAAFWAAVRIARRWPRAGPREYAACIPLAWLLATVGALAGTALFGGTPLATLFWLAVGVAAAGPSLLGEPIPEAAGEPARPTVAAAP